MTLSVTLQYYQRFSFVFYFTIVASELNRTKPFSRKGSTLKRLHCYPYLTLSCDFAVRKTFINQSIHSSINQSIKQSINLYLWRETLNSYTTNKLEALSK